MEHIKHNTYPSNKHYLDIEKVLAVLIVALESNVPTYM
jgi:hypothetical protein